MYRLYYFAKKAVESIRSAPFVNALTIGTIALSLFVFGIFLLFYTNLDRLFSGWENRIGITAYLKDNTPDKVIADLEARIKGLEGAQQVTFVTAERALVRGQMKVGYHESKGPFSYTLMGNLDIPYNLYFNIGLLGQAIFFQLFSQILSHLPLRFREYQEDVSSHGGSPWPPGKLRQKTVLLPSLRFW